MREIKTRFMIRVMAKSKVSVKAGAKAGVKSGIKTSVSEFEIFEWEKLEPHPVIGVDEVGRGCLAGPVYAAAVIVPLEVASELAALTVVARVE